jgi:hypothetical protein
MNKNVFFLSLFLTFALLGHFSCKNMAKAAAKHWTKKQIKKFKNYCTEKTSNKFGNERAISFCNCATNLIMEKYPNADDALNLQLMDIISSAKECVSAN